MVKLILGYILLLTLLTGLVYRNSIYHVLFVPGRPNTTKLREKPQERTEKANRKKTVRKKTRRPGKKKYYSLGRHYFRQGKCEQGNRYYKKALKLDPDNNRAYEKLVVYMKKCLQHKKNLKQKN